MCAQTGSLNTYKHAFVPLQPHIHTNTPSTAQINDWINHTHTVFACHPVCFPFIRQVQFPRLLKLYQRFHRICIQQGHLSLHQEISLPRGCVFAVEMSIVPQSDALQSTFVNTCCLEPYHEQSMQLVQTFFFPFTQVNSCWLWFIQLISTWGLNFIQMLKC